MSSAERVQDSHIPKCLGRGPSNFSRGRYHTGREIGKCAEQSHDGPGGEPAEGTRSQVTSEELHLRIGGLH